MIDAPYSKNIDFDVVQIAVLARVDEIIELPKYI